MKKSTRISLGVSVVWLAFTVWEMVNGTRGAMDFGEAFTAQPLGLIVIWAVKLLIDYKIDGKED